MAKQELFEGMRSRMRSWLPADTYARWIGPLQAASLYDDRLVVQAPSHVARWAQDYYQRLLNTAVREYSGLEGLSVEIMSLSTSGRLSKTTRRRTRREYHF